jgi:hypothetical protein
MRIISIYPLLIALTVLSFACSSNHIDPVNQNLPVDTSFSISEKSPANHNLAGFWKATFDVEKKTADIESVREAQSHINVTHLLPMPGLNIKSWDPVDEVMDIDVTVNNPYDITGYDLRLIIFSDAIGHGLVNNDGYTSVFDIPAGVNINPFKAYGTSNQFREFFGLNQETQNLKIHMPGGNYQVLFAIDVSFPFNCTEPYEIVNFIQEENLYSVSDSSTWIQVTVNDWNNQVSSVTIAAPEITGEPETQLQPQGNFVWGIDLVNTQAAPAGSYEVLITGTCDLPETLSLYDYATINVKNADEVVDWVTLVYMHESNLGAYAVMNLNTLERVGSKKYETDIVVLWDKENDPNDVILHIEKDPSGYNPNIVSIEIDDGGEVIPPGGVDMGSGQTLEKFLRWSINHYPARHYGLILWDHGNGPFSFLDTVVKSCCNGLQVWEIRDACSTVLSENPQMNRFDWIGFDCCLMGYIEIAYCLRNVTDITIGSEMVEPAPGWNYYPWVDRMTRESDTITGEEMSYEIVADYLIGSGGIYEKTLTAIRSDDLVNNVIPALDNFATALMNGIDQGKKSTISTCRTDCGKWGAFCDEGFIKDLGYFAELCSAKTSLSQDIRDTADILIQEIENSIILHGHTGDDASACPYMETGLQIWLPSAYWSSDNTNKRSDYQNLEFTDTQWDEFLAAFSS